MEIYSLSTKITSITVTIDRKLVYLLSFKHYQEKIRTLTNTAGSVRRKSIVHLSS